MLPLAQNTQKREISVMMKCFIPYQLTTSGCCGMRKAIFETSRDLWRRAENWLQISSRKLIQIISINNSLNKFLSQYSIDLLFQMLMYSLLKLITSKNGLTVMYHVTK